MLVPIFILLSMIVACTACSGPPIEQIEMERQVFELYLDYLGAERKRRFYSSLDDAEFKQLEIDQAEFLTQLREKKMEGAMEEIAKGL